MKGRRPRLDYRQKLSACGGSGHRAPVKRGEQSRRLPCGSVADLEAFDGSVEEEVGLSSWREEEQEVLQVEERMCGLSVVAFPLQVTVGQGEGVKLPSILKGLLDVSRQGFQGRPFGMVVFRCSGASVEGE